jgi:hypothetical protein
MNSLRSCLRRWARTLGALCFLVSCSGCYFCYSARDALQGARAGYREFREPVLTNTLPLRGAYVGNMETKGVAYSCYQFTNVLAGRQTRVLDLLVAGSEQATNIISETTRPRAESEPAFLLLQPMSGDYTPAQYFRQHYPSEEPRVYNGRSMYLCVYGDSPWDLYLLRENPTTGQMAWVKTQAKDHVAWVIRSRSAYRLGHLRYLYAVPLDIVTSPFQLFVALKLSHG